MKNKLFIKGLISFVLAITGGCMAFLNVFDFALGRTGVNSHEPFSFFTESNSIASKKILYTTIGKTYSSTFKLIAGILAMVVIAIAIAYIILIICDKKSPKLVLVRKILSIALVVAGVLIATSLIIYLAQNNVRRVATVYCSVVPAILITAGPITAGVWGYLFEKPNQQ